MHFLNIETEILAYEKIESCKILHILMKKDIKSLYITLKTFNAFIQGYNYYISSVHS